MFILLVFWLVVLLFLRIVVIVLRDCGGCYCFAVVLTDCGDCFRCCVNGFAIMLRKCFVIVLTVCYFLGVILIYC